MGAYKNEKQAKRDARRSYGRAEVADWRSVDGEAIRDCICAAGMVNGAVRFGYTRDGGAYAIGLYGLGDQPFTTYVRPGENVDAVLREIAEDYRDAKRPTETQT